MNQVLMGLNAENPETVKKDPIKKEPEPKTDHKAGDVKGEHPPPTPITSKKDVKKPAEKTGPAVTDKAIPPKEKEPKKIMGGSKKDDKRPEPPQEEKPAEVPK
jgi:hypothetical protein